MLTIILNFSERRFRVTNHSESKYALGVMLLYIFLATALVNCGKNPVKEGTYVVYKDSLKAGMEKEIGTDNLFSASLLDKVIENAIIEFEVRGDSLRGLIFLAGEGTSFNSKILVRNDSLIVGNGKATAFLTKTMNGFTFKRLGTKLNIPMQFKEGKLSPETEKAMATFRQKEKEKKEFEDNLGKWQKGTFVDEFGDKTGKAYFYSIVTGHHENSISVNSDVLVKVVLDGNSLYFEVFNSSLTMKENFPDDKFGTIKIKYPDGRVEHERIFFYKNSALESPDDKNNLIYNYLNSKDGELKLLIDLGTASEYYSDKYQFNIKQNNLKGIL